MSYIDDAYKRTAAARNAIPWEVTALRSHVGDAVKRGIDSAIKAGKRSIQGYLFNESAYFSPEDAYMMLAMDKYWPIPPSQIDGFGALNIKRLIEQDLRTEIGLRTVTVEFIAFTHERHEDAGLTVFGRPKYKIVKEPAYKLWIQGSW